MGTREKDRYKDESESARIKNRENLTQTQEGMKAFKDQIDVLKQELTDEKRAGRELKRQIDEKTRSSENEISNIRRDSEKHISELDEKKKKVRELEDKISDIEEKWAKSKRINQQRKDKIDKLEQELEKKPDNSSGEGDVAKLRREIDSLKKEKNEVVKKHEQLEEEYVVLKAKLT